MTEGRFISQEIQVERDTESGEPRSFQWNGRDYPIKEIIASWPDWGFSAGAPKKKTWTMRRHRNCYRVETSDSSVFELYHDRGTKPGRDKWFLYRQLS
jgi:hypothetical protein